MQLIMIFYNSHVPVAGISFSDSHRNGQEERSQPDAMETLINFVP